MAQSPTATAPFLEFGERALEMERYAVAALEKPLMPTVERTMTIDLLRHARGIKAVAERWRRVND